MLRLKNKDGGTYDLPDSHDGKRSGDVIVNQSGGYWSWDKDEVTEADEVQPAASTKTESSKGSKGGGS